MVAEYYFGEIAKFESVCEGEYLQFGFKPDKKISETYSKHCFLMECIMMQKGKEDSSFDMKKSSLVAETVWLSNRIVVDLLTFSGV